MMTYFLFVSEISLIDSAYLCGDRTRTQPHEAAQRANQKMPHARRAKQTVRQPTVKLLPRNSAEEARGNFLRGDCFTNYHLTLPKTIYVSRPWCLRTSTPTAVSRSETHLELILAALVKYSSQQLHLSSSLASSLLQGRSYIRFSPSLPSCPKHRAFRR